MLTLHFAEVEEIKKEGSDFVLDIDIRPNRASDCLSHLGLAGEIAAILNYSLHIEKDKLMEDKKSATKNFISVEIRSFKFCSRYTARVATNVKIFPSPKWLQDRLKSCGLRPINNIVDIANYVMLELGQPLHAFDAEKIAGKKIVVRLAKEGEKIVTLDEEKYGLPEGILVIASDKDPLAVAGIKGGKSAEINAKTKTIVLEAANFSNRVVRKGSKAIDLKTDASLRFEHGLDPNLTEVAINRAAYLIQKIAGGKTAQGLVDFYPKRVLPKKIKLDLSYAKSLLGIEIPEIKMKNILIRLGFKLKAQKNSKLFEVEIPTRRLDVLVQEDLIEEIGRIYGYQKIANVLPFVPLALPERNLDIFWENFVKDALKEGDFNEVYNYSFVSEKDVDIFKWKKEELLELENPLSSDSQYLRPSLIPNLLKNVEKNQKNFKEIKIFELGKVFIGSSEKRMLVCLMVGDKFYEAKGIVDVLLNKLGISDIYYDEYQAKSEELKSFICYPEKCAEIKIGGESIGFLGEILPKFQAGYKIDGRAVLINIDFEKLLKLAREEQEYRSPSRFPSAVRDIALLVPRFIKVDDVLNEIQKSGGDLVKDVDLFDIYEGEELPEGKKNLAFHIIYQAEDRTLSSKEIDDLQNKIIAALEKEKEWQVRK